MTGRTVVTHPLPPVWDAHSRVLILGTMPSPASRAQGFYYAHPQNRFWRVLSAVLSEQEPAADPAARRDFALRHGIALFDVLRRCEIAGASDASIRAGEPNDFSAILAGADIRAGEPNDFSAILAGADIRAVFTTGKRAFSLYTRLCLPATGRAAVCLPSPSAANCRVSLEELIRAYAPIRAFLEEV